MPPKPKSAAKDKRKEPVEIPPDEPPDEDPDEWDLNEREALIAKLKLRLDGAIDKESSLRALHDKLKSNLRGERIDFEDISNFLKKELEDRVISTELLQSHINELEFELVERAADFDAAVQKAKRDAEAHMKMLTDRLQETRIAMVEFQSLLERKAYLNESLRTADILVAQQRAMNEAAVADREREAVQEKDRLRRKLQEDIYQTKLSMLTRIESDLKERTKQAIIHCDELDGDLVSGGRRAYSATKDNIRLFDQRDALVRDVELSKERQAKLGERNAALEGALEALKEDLKQHEQRILQAEEEYEASQDDLEELRQITDEVKHELKVRGQLLKVRKEEQERPGADPAGQGAEDVQQIIEAVARTKRELRVTDALDTVTVTTRLRAIERLFAILEQETTTANAAVNKKDDLMVRRGGGYSRESDRQKASGTSSSTGLATGLVGTSRPPTSSQAAGSTTIAE